MEEIIAKYNVFLEENVYDEKYGFGYAIGRNINKYHRFLCSKIEKFEGKKKKISFHERCGLIEGEPLFNAAKNKYYSSFS